MPLQRRIPKRGFHCRSREPFAVLNLKDLAGLEGADPITPEVLHARGLLKGKGKRLKILGEGEIQRPLVVHAHGFSKSAEAKIRAAGGRVEVIARA
jgi:large subunit ribosomal protein L15